MSLKKSKFFQAALSRFVFDAAKGDSIRHFTDKGMTALQIQRQLDVPVDLDTIKETMWEHLLEIDRILIKEPGVETKEKATFVKVESAYGKPSFQRVVEPKSDPVKWVKRIYYGEKEELVKWLQEQKKNQKSERVYVACDFIRGISEAPMKFQCLEGVLDTRQMEYLESILWPEQTVYHLVDVRMLEILQSIKKMPYVFWFSNEDSE